MRILQINIRLSEGGAATIARDIHRGILEAGHQSVFAYGYGPGARPSGDEATIPGSFHLSTRGQAIANFAMHRVVGIDAFAPTAAHRVALLRQIEQADVVHLHVIHSYFLSYRWLLGHLAAAKKPVVWTMHDNWILTGRCAFTGDCDRWRQGCGHCPAPHHYPPGLLDRTRQEAVSKRRLLETLRDQLVHVPIAKFMQDRLEQVFPGHRTVRIPNGIDARMENALAQATPAEPDKRLRVLLTGADLSDPAKHDLPFLQSLIDQLNIEVVTVGAHSPFAGPQVRNLGRLTSREDMARAYLSADVVLFTSKVDIFPLTILEALCAGTPVLALPSEAASEVLGMIGASVVSEQQMVDILATGHVRRPFGERTREELSASAHRLFGHRAMIDSYLGLYKSLVPGTMFV